MVFKLNQDHEQAKMNNPGINMIENSHSVQVYASTRSIWRGNMWSLIHVNIKLDKYFLLNKDVPGGRFILRAYLEKSSSKGSYINDDSMYLKLWFNSSRRANQRYLLVTLDSYNTLDVEVHRELFSSGDAFRVIVIAEDRLDGATETIFGASQSIVVTDLSLSIEHRFLDSPYCDFVKQDVFAWYSKCGGEQSSLSALIHLKDANNNAPKFVDGLELLAELVYEDGSPTPLKPICPLKDRKSGQISNKPLFRLCTKPRLLPGESCASFSFRIEEVTFHHSGHHGFKLKISPADSLPLIIHPAISSEIIVVLSKPKSGLRNSNMHQQSNTLVATQPKKRKVSASVKEDGKSAFEVPISLLITGYRVNGKCLTCKRKISIEKFLERGEHTRSCSFATLVVPTALGYYYKQEGVPFPAIHVKSELPCVSLPTREVLASSTSKNIPIPPPPDNVIPIYHPLPHTWREGDEEKYYSSSGEYKAKRESSNADYLFTSRENVCSSFTFQDTEEVSERYPMQTHPFLDKPRIEKDKTCHLVPPHAYSFFETQGDESCILNPNEDLRGRDLVEMDKPHHVLLSHANSFFEAQGDEEKDKTRHLLPTRAYVSVEIQGDEWCNFTPKEESRERNLVPYCSDNTLTMDTDDCSEVTLKNTMCMEENERYLLQEFPLASDGANRLVQESFLVEESSENTSCTNRLAQETFKGEETNENFMMQLMDTFSSTGESCSEENKSAISSSSNINSYEKGGLGHEFVDRDSVTMNIVDEPSFLYEPIALSVENLNDDCSAFNTTKCKSVPESLSGSPLSEVALDENTELNFNLYSDYNALQQPCKSSNSPIKDLNRTTLDINCPDKVMCFDNEFNIQNSYLMKSISPIRQNGF